MKSIKLNCYTNRRNYETYLETRKEIEKILHVWFQLRFERVERVINQCHTLQL